MGKGENAGNQHFLVFPQCFLLFLGPISIFESHLSSATANALNLYKSKNLLFGKGLRTDFEVHVYKFYLTSAFQFVTKFDCLIQSSYLLTGICFQDWQWYFGTIAVFMAWIELILFIQKFPELGIYVVMFKYILYTFFKFALVFLLFIVAFGMGFYCLIQNQVLFCTYCIVLMILLSSLL